VLSYYVAHKEIPFATKQELEKQLPFLKKKFLYAADFAKTDLYALFGEDKINGAEKLTVNYFSNAVLMNKGNMKFEMKPLPFQAQLSSYKTAIIVNANKDSLPDIMMMGNYYDSNVELGRIDGDFGTILVNKGKGDFEYQPLDGLVVTGQVRNIQPIEINNQKAFILARNNDSLIVIKFK
jgi:hypothetical protein